MLFASTLYFLMGSCLHLLWIPYSRSFLRMDISSDIFRMEHPNQIGLLPFHLAEASQNYQSPRWPHSLILQGRYLRIFHWTWYRLAWLHSVFILQLDTTLILPHTLNCQVNQNRATKFFNPYKINLDKTKKHSPLANYGHLFLRSILWHVYRISLGKPYLQ